MQFAVTYLIDQMAPSETFIRRELDQLRRRDWPIYTRLLKGGQNPLHYALFSCPEGFRMQFAKAALARILEEIFRCPIVALRIIKRLPQTAYLIKKMVDTDTRLIHSQFSGITADLAAIAAKTLGINWTCSVHAYDIYCTPASITRRRLRTASGISACSQSVADATAAVGVPLERIHLIHHGLPLNDFHINTIQLDEFIFTACRLTEKKGIDTLLQAYSLLKDRGIEIPCIIAGTGPDFTKLKRMSVKLNLNDRVFFKGWQSQEETRSHIKNSILTVLPSRRTKNGDRDGIANILVEALALGAPVITTTAGAAPEVIQSEQNGILIEPDDHLALADAIERVIKSKPLRNKLIKEGRKTAESIFDGAENIHQLEKLFKSAAITLS
ncbi:MAG: glycosyltransferase [Kiritimatiellae bacterium]|jgi:glycosyltransferase involved in cell wall biosynthesis|nr:glycosyltransferase [Kiritimatiellia bacterium]